MTPTFRAVKRTNLGRIYIFKMGTASTLTAGRGMRGRGAQRRVGVAWHAQRVGFS